MIEWGHSVYNTHNTRVGVNQVEQARLINRMFLLFKSNKRSLGRWDPDTNKNVTAERAYTEADFAQHFYGEVGLGLVPIDDAGTCQWGAIDIDNHGQEDDLPIGIVAKKIADLGYPLIACRSKSGGIHCYTFYNEPIPAEIVRRRLTTMATELGYGGAEVFPKQSRLQREAETGNLQLGNYINLPFFAEGDEEHAWRNRYAKVWDEVGVRQIDLKEFCDRAEKIQSIEDTYTNAKASEHPEAPPCLQKMMMVGVPEGYRNEALFNFAVYMRKAHDLDWRDRVSDINAQVFEVPMPTAEVKKILGSVGRRTYRYRCQQEPCKSLCNSKLCLTRQFGIKPTEISNTGDPDKFEMLRRVNTEPPRWLIRVNGQDVPLLTEQLMKYQALELRVLEHSSIVLRPMKADEWRLALGELMRTLVTIEAPDDASTSGQMAGRLAEYLHKALDARNLPSTEIARTLDLGRPVRMEREDGDWVFFKGTEFVKHLKRTKGEDMRGPDMWMALRKMGVDHGDFSLGGKKHNLWRYPYQDSLELPMSEPDVEI